MGTTISSSNGKLLAALAAAALAVMLGIKPASAITVTNLVSNGDFTLNAAGFMNYPYYVGETSPTNPPNPASITDWVSVNGALGSPTDGTGLNFAPAAISGTAPFGPASLVFAFIQGAGSSVSQAVSGLTVGQSYSVSYLAAGKNSEGHNPTDDPQEQLTASISNGTKVDGSLVSNDSTNMNNIAFSGQLFGFTASATTETLTFENTSPATLNSTPVDTAVDVANVVIDPIGSPVPEPTTWMLFLSAFAGGALLLTPRRLRRA